MNFFSIFCGISLLVAVLPNKLCFRDLCSHGKRHIACGHTGEFAPSCPDDAKLLDMKPYKEKILHMINSQRNEIALGNMRGFSKAKRMATMEWDDDLAALAAMNVQGCEMMHDCHHTETYKFSSQLLSLSSGTRKKKPEILLTASIKSWFDKHKNCTMDIINSFPNLEGVRQNIAQFTCLVSELNTAVGCAIATYMSCQKQEFLLACNFANCNHKGIPVYVAGRTGYGCTTGVNTKYRGLCSEDEVFKVNFEF